MSDIIQSISSPSSPSSLTDTLPEASPEQREEDVRREQSLLWEHVKTLLDSGRIEEGLLLCRIRLTDPLAHVPPPASSLPDELRVIGNSMHGLAIYKQYVAPNAPCPDAMRNHEVVRAYKLAAEGAVRYYHRHAWQISHFLHDFSLSLSRQTDQASSISDYELLVDLHKAVVHQKKPHDLEKMVEETEEYKASVLMLIVALQKLEQSYMAAKRRADAFGVFSEAGSVLHEYADNYGTDQDISRNEIAVLVTMATRLTDDESTDEETQNVLLYLTRCRRIVEVRREEKEKDVYNDPNHIKLEESYAAAIGNIAVRLSSNPDPNGVYNARELYSEGTVIYRRLCRLPVDLEDGVPPDVSLSHVANYARMLCQLSTEQDTFSQMLDLLERALRIDFISIGFQPTEDRSPVPAYLSLIEKRDWDKFDFYQLKFVMYILDKLTDVRSDWILGMRQEESPAPDGMMGLLEKEAALNSHLAELLVILAHTEDQVEQAKIDKADSLVLKGNVKRWKFGFQEEWKDITKCWLEALQIVTSFTSSGNNEQSRLGTIKMAEALLDQFRVSDPDLRQKLVYEESRGIWACILDKETYLEQLEMCRERIINPFAYATGTVIGTPDELKVEGYHFLAVSLNALYGYAGDPEWDQQILEAYQKAADGYRLYFSVQKARLSRLLLDYADFLERIGKINGSIETYKETIQLIKEQSLSRKQMERTEFDKAIKRGLIKAMRSLAEIYEESKPRVSALELMEEAWQIVQDYEEMYGPDDDLEPIKLRAQVDLGCSLYYAKRQEDALVVSEKAAEGYIVLCERIEGSGKESLRDFSLSTLKDGYATALLNINVCSGYSDRSTFLGKSRSEIRLEGAEVTRSAANVPEDLDAGVDSDYNPNPAHLDKHYKALLSTVQDMTSDQQKIAIFQRAMRILDLRIQIASNSKPLAIVPYSLALKNSRWEGASLSPISDGIGLLQNIMKLRCSQPAGKMAIPLSGSDSDIIRQETDLALFLSSLPPRTSPSGKCDLAQLRTKAEFLVFKAEVLRGKGDQITLRWGGRTGYP